MADSKKEVKTGEAETLKPSQPGEEQDTKLNDSELDAVSGGLKKLPGKKKPPTLTLK